MPLRLFIFILTILATGFSLLAQQSETRYSEEEVTIEGQFIEAKKYKLLGDLDAAKDLFKQILKKYRNHDVAAYELAEIFHREKNFEDALHHINLALGIDARNKWYLHLKAQIFIEDKKYGAAAEVYESLNKLDPKNLNDLEKKAWLYAKDGQQSQAIEILEQIEREVGVTEKTAYARHDLYKQLGKKKQATDVLEDLIDHFPSNVEYRHVLASYYKKIGRETHAEDVYKDILRIDPQDARANVALASSYKKEGNDGGYLSSIRPIIESPEANIDIKIAELMPYIKQLQKQEDPEVLNQLLQLVELLEQAHPEDAKAYALHADVLTIGNQSEKAIEYYKKTLEYDESNYLVWEQLLLLLVENHHMDDLAKSSEEAMEIFPNQSMFFYLNGLAMMNLGDYDAAVDVLDQALIMVGSKKDLKVNILALLAKSYYEIANYDQSTEAYDNALLISPADVRLLNDYSYSLAQMGERLDEANKMIDKALINQANNPRFLATKGWIAYRMQNLAEAREMLERSLKNGGDKYSYILEKYGDILYKTDQREKALKYWEEARKVGAGSKWLDRKIEEEKLIEEQ
ncbi:MAG: tetratricopeptide repeat protein [Saprospiraceae bacterium]|nr:tetratricopeptide repeat protein [Saprospiraceae bacterium]